MKEQLNQEFNKGFAKLVSIVSSKQGDNEDSLGFALELSSDVSKETTQELTKAGIKPVEVNDADYLNLIAKLKAKHKDEKKAKHVEQAETVKYDTTIASPRNSQAPPNVLTKAIHTLEDVEEEKPLLEPSPLAVKIRNVKSLNTELGKVVQIARDEIYNEPSAIEVSAKVTFKFVNIAGTELGETVEYFRVKGNPSKHGIVYEPIDVTGVTFYQNDSYEPVDDLPTQVVLDGDTTKTVTIVYRSKQIAVKRPQPKPVVPVVPVVAPKIEPLKPVVTNEPVEVKKDPIIKSETLYTVAFIDFETGEVVDEFVDTTVHEGRLKPNGDYRWINGKEKTFPTFKVADHLPDGYIAKDKFLQAVTVTHESKDVFYTVDVAKVKAPGVVNIQVNYIDRATENAITESVFVDGIASYEIDWTNHKYVVSDVKVPEFNQEIDGYEFQEEVRKDDVINLYYEKAETDAELVDSLTTEIDSLNEMPNTNELLDDEIVFDEDEIEAALDEELNDDVDFDSLTDDDVEVEVYTDDLLNDAELDEQISLFDDEQLAALTVDVPDTEEEDEAAEEIVEEDVIEGQLNLFEPAPDATLSELLEAVSEDEQVVLANRKIAGKLIKHVIYDDYDALIVTKLINERFTNKLADLYEVETNHSIEAVNEAIVHGNAVIGENWFGYGQDLLPEQLAEYAFEQLKLNNFEPGDELSANVTVVKHYIRHSGVNPFDKIDQYVYDVILHIK